MTEKPQFGPQWIDSTTVVYERRHGSIAARSCVMVSLSSSVTTATPGCIRGGQPPRRHAGVGAADREHRDLAAIAAIDHGRPHRLVEIAPRSAARDAEPVERVERLEQPAGPPVEHVVVAERAHVDVGGGQARLRSRG